MKGKITLETGGEAEICCSVEMRNMTRRDKILLIDALCTCLNLGEPELSFLAMLLSDGIIGRKGIPGKMVVATDMDTVKKIVKEMKQKSEGD